MPFIPVAAGNVVTDWTTIASTTIVMNGGKAPGSSGVWFAYTSLAVYDAINAITGQYRPFYYHGAAPQNASFESAAVAAAHRILVNSFPAQQSDLDARFAASLSAIGAAKAKDAGVAVGEAAAASLIAARTDDGLEANVSYVPGSGAGVWIPTPPAFASALAISARVDRSASDKRSRDGSWALRMRFSAVRYSLRSNNSWLTRPVTKARMRAQWN